MPTTIQSPKRRRTDRDANAARTPDLDARREDEHTKGWILACGSRLVGLDASLSLAEAVEIAESLKAFERTGAMEPAAAAEFVAQEMRRPGVPRFERRTGGNRSTG
jgi:hypothetical protein